MRILNFKRNIVLIILMLQSAIFYSQSLPIIGFDDAANYRIGHYLVPGSDGLDLHWYGGIRFGDSTSDSVMQITNGKIGIGTPTPNYKLDVLKSTITNENDVIVNFARDGTATGGSSIVRFGYHNTCDFEINSGYSGTGHRFGSYYDLNIANNYTGGLHGGVNFATNGSVKMAIRPNGNVGIGTTSPTKLLDIQNSNAGAGESYIWIKKGIDATNVNREAGIILGTGAGDYGNTFKIAAMSSTGYFDAPKLNFKYTNPGGAGIIDLLTIDSFGKVGIGTTTPDEKLTVKGKIHTQEVKVDLLGACVPDYVFASDYKLKTLQEVEEFINKNNHLPEIPSAKEIEKNGLMLAEMNMNLLKKVEELTLYVIEQNKELKMQTEDFAKQNALLKYQNEKILTLEKKIENIEALTR